MPRPRASPRLGSTSGAHRARLRAHARRAGDGRPLRRAPARARDRATTVLAAAAGRGHRRWRAGRDRGVRRPSERSPSRRGARLRLVDRGDARALGRRRAASSRASSRTSKPRARRCTSSCSAGGRARWGCGWPPCWSASCRRVSRCGSSSTGSAPGPTCRRARCSRGSPRRARRSSSTTSSRRTGRPLPRRPPGLAPGPARPRRPSQAVRHRRQRRLDGRRRHRGPLQRRPLPRPDGAGHR